METYRPDLVTGYLKDLDDVGVKRKAEIKTEGWPGLIKN